jgi:surfactin synthase thioesterase subunit
VHPSLNDPNRVIIVQTADRALEYVEGMLKRTGLESGKDFVALSSTEGLDQRMLPNSPQLLFTGSFGGMVAPVCEMVNRLLRTNPRLEVVYLSGFAPENSEFKEVILRMDRAWPSKVAERIAAFREEHFRGETV